MSYIAKNIIYNLRIKLAIKYMRILNFHCGKFYLIKIKINLKIISKGGISFRQTFSYKNKKLF